MRTLLLFTLPVLLAACSTRQTADTQTDNIADGRDSIMTVSMQQMETSPIGLELEAAGYVNIAKADSTILVSLMYTRPDNFTGQVLYNDLHEAYLHPDALQPLLKAQQLLRDERPDLRLIIFDAARPMSIQQQMWDVVASTSKSRYVSNPANGGGMHNYGLAVDLSIAYADGDTIPMGTTVDHMGIESHITDETTLVGSGKISEEALHNRQLLRRVMTEAGFKTLSNEWWHFNLVSRSTAIARYKAIE